MSAKIIDPCSLRIKKALSVRNIKQAELCDRANISKSTLSEYLKGKYEPKQDKIFLMAQALNVDPVWLMGYDVPMEKKEQPEQKSSPGELQLTEGEKAFIKLLRRLPLEERAVVLDQILSELDD